MASLSFKQALSYVKKLFLNLVTSTYISFLPTVEEESAGKSHSLLNSNNHSHITHSHITHTHTHTHTMHTLKTHQRMLNNTGHVGLIILLQRNLYTCI